MRQYASSDCHEKPASRIDTIEELQRHMCTLAVERKKFHPSVCVCCEYPCAYGLKALDMLGIPKCETAQAERIIVPGIARETFSKRVSGFRKERVLDSVARR